MLATQKAAYRIVDHDVVVGESNQDYVLRVKDLPDAEKPREKLTTVGPQELSVAELVAILWSVGSKKEDVLAMAHRTIKEYGERALGNELSAMRLAETANIPLGKATQVVAAFELGRRYYSTAAGRPVHVRNAKQAYQHLKAMGHLQKEQLRGLYLNSRYQVVHDEVISVGSLTSNIVHPREVFQPAIERGAAALIIAHNHPSGSLQATLADVQVTDQLEAAGDILGIELLDHLIIAGNKFVSIRDSGHAS
ncbi:MAG: radC [Candidatus Saccharibacteria bacterium]|nr:radC [Candidatus Saccharibacteria bacterium]